MSLENMVSNAIAAFFGGLVNFEKSVGTKGIIAILFTVAGAGSVLAGLPVPDWFVEAIKMVIALYFGGSLALTGVKK